MPFAVFTAIASHRVRDAGLDAGRLIALVGGTSAAVLLALPGLATGALVPLLPIGRFGTMIWLLAATVGPVRPAQASGTLAVRRQRRRD